jgi:hypothetical protein
MARITIENAEVTRYLGNKGYVAEVKYRTRAGDDKIEKWTVWGDQPEVGSVHTITGDLTVKLEEFESDNGTVRYARGHINNPSLASAPQEQPTFDITDGTPF